MRGAGHGVGFSTTVHVPSDLACASGPLLVGEEGRAVGVVEEVRERAEIVAIRAWGAAGIRAGAGRAG